MRTERGVHAYEDKCPHLGYPLSRGRLEGGTLTCRAHEFRFDADSGRGQNPKHLQLTGNVKILVMNNRFLGMVRQWQELLYDRRYSEVGLKYFPDFVKIAEAYGATGFRAEKPEELRSVLERGLATPGTVLMDIIVHKETNVFPMIPGGAAHYEILLGPEDDEAPQPRELA